MTNSHCGRKPLNTFLKFNISSLKIIINDFGAINGKRLFERDSGIYGRIFSGNYYSNDHNPAI